ncbi:acyltransferase family protein [Saccharicrinis sp. GN24d3]|uniref:acyltransferase family protein n=1 Tax=Saccharicrinis sp. GN24d3 TaxID=3458416 RepID=UPI0040362116
MPLFFILSGFVQSDSSKKNIVKFIIGKIKSLLVPFLFWGLLFCRNDNYAEWKDVLYASSLSLSYAKTFSPLWFLPCLFFLLLFLYRLRNLLMTILIL